MDPAQSTLESQSKEETQPVVVRREPEKDLFVWTAPSRPFKRRTREYYITLFAIVGIVGLILFIAEGAMPVVLLISVSFLFYVLSTIQPEDIEYKITTQGIKVAGRRTDWQLLGRFWFSKRFDSDLLVIETFILPGRVELVIKPEDKETIKTKLSAYLSQEEIPASGLEKITNWFSSKLPGQ